MSDIITKLQDDEFYYSDKRYLTNSMLGYMSESYFWFYQYLHNGYKYPHQVHFDIGRYFHVSVLEPHKVDSLFFKSNYKTRRSKGFSDDVIKAESQGKVALTMTEWTMVDNMATNTLENDFIGELLQQSQKEVPNVKEINGVWCKGKADSLDLDIGMRLGVDLKSTSKQLEEFIGSAYKYNYDRQAAMYMELFDLDEFWFVPVEKSGAHRVGVYQFTRNSDFIIQGRDKLYRLIDTYRELFINGGYDPQETLIKRYE